MEELQVHIMSVMLITTTNCDLCGNNIIVFTLLLVFGHQINLLVVFPSLFSSSWGHGLMASCCRARAPPLLHAVRPFNNAASELGHGGLAISDFF